MPARRMAYPATGCWIEVWRAAGTPKISAHI